jgi:hypothetical protein
MRVLRNFILFLTAPLAWTLHFLLSYLLISVGCSRGWQSGMRPTLLLLALLFAGISLWPLLRAWRLRTHVSSLEWLATHEEESRTTHFMLGLGVALTAVFALAILLGGLGTLLVPICASGSHH